MSGPMRLSRRALSISGIGLFALGVCLLFWLGEHWWGVIAAVALLLGSFAVGVILDRREAANRRRRTTAGRHRR